MQTKKKMEDKQFRTNLTTQAFMSRDIINLLEYTCAALHNNVLTSIPMSSPSSGVQAFEKQMFSQNPAYCG